MVVSHSTWRTLLYKTLCRSIPSNSCVDKMYKENPYRSTTVLFRRNCTEDLFYQWESSGAFRQISIGGCDNPCSSVIKRNMARLWATWGEFLSFFHSRPISTLTSRTVCLLYTHLLFLFTAIIVCDRVVIYRSSLLPVSPTHSHPYASFVDPIWLAESSGKLQSARRQVL